MTCIYIRAIMVYLTAMARAHPYGRIARLRIGCDNKSVMCRSVLSYLFSLADARVTTPLTFM